MYAALSALRPEPHRQRDVGALICEALGQRCLSFEHGLAALEGIVQRLGLDR
jgi:hypothetical protein